MFSTELRIPKERIAVLIGKNGETKRKVEKKADIKLRISKEGEVNISSEDNVAIFISTNVIRAIGRGCNPDIALQLIDEKNALELINIQDFTGKSIDKMNRLRARLIGTEGKARKTIEKLTNTDIVIYGKTVAIIGEIIEVAFAKNAIEKLLGGSPHGNVYKYIVSQKRRESQNL